VAALSLADSSERQAAILPLGPSSGRQWVEPPALSLAIIWISEQRKYWQKHRVAWWECEEVFFNQPSYAFRDERHSLAEERYYALGKTTNGRLLFVVFTRRRNKIRIISARDMHKKEQRIYNEKAQEDTAV
jgi:uncharacterized DUF497 family protein